jgi:APA family basic amino acid/polyamine antiporter
MNKLPRTLGLRDLTLLVIGTVIGSGIFLVPAAVLRQVDGSVAPALLVWLVGGVLSLLGALTYGELSAAKPEAGGLYVYIRDCFGPFAAFLYGWTLFFVIGSGSVATLAVAFSSYLAQVIPISGWWQSKGVAVAMILLVTAINVRGARHSANVQNWSTAIKAGAIILMSAALLIWGTGLEATGQALWPGATGSSLISSFGIAMIPVLWAYEGWQYCTFSAGETINSQRNFPRAFFMGTVALILLYLLANVAYLAALGPEAAAREDRVAAAAVSAVIGPDAATVVAIAILISMFSAANGVMLTSPRVYYAMAADGLFFRRLAEVHPRFKTPALAVMVGALSSMAYALWEDFEKLLGYVVFAGWIFYGLAAASIFVYRKQNRGAALPYRVPGYPVTPLLFIVSAAALVVNAIITDPLKVVVPLGILLLGAPVYLLWRRKSAAQDSKAR